MKNSKKIKSWFRVLFTPSCWMQNESYSKEWEEELKELMDKHKFSSIGTHTAKLGEQEIWVANHPYSSFTPYPKHVGVRPSRATILEAHDKLIRDWLDIGGNDERSF